MKRIVSFFSLFTSLSTILCCALPALFVVLGLGAVFAGLVSAFPQLIWISEHKVSFFIFGGIMLLVAGILQWQSRGTLECPIDEGTGQACKRTRDWSLWVYCVSLALYGAGTFFAFLAPRLFS